MRSVALIVLLAACSSQKAPPPPSKTPRPFGALSRVYIGMPRYEVAKVAPELKPGPTDNVTLEQGQNRYTVFFDAAGIVDGIEIQDPRTVADFVRAWGPGLEDRTKQNHHSYPAGTMFATVRPLPSGPTQVDFIPMNTLDVTFGFGSDLGPFGHQVLGNRGDQVDAMLKPYGLRAEGAWNIVDKVPRTEVGTFAFKYLRESDAAGNRAEIVSAINFSMQFDVKGAKAIILPFLEKKFGKPTVAGDTYTYTVRGTKLAGVITDESLSLTAP